LCKLSCKKFARIATISAKVAGGGLLFMFTLYMTTDLTVNLWPPNVVKRGLCHRKGCASVCLSHLWSTLKISKYTSHRTEKCS